MIRQILQVSALLPLIALNSCSSYERFRQITEEFEHPSQIYDSNYDKVWQATLTVMQKFDVASIENGVIKTRWSNNTKSYNFINVLGYKRNVRDAEFQLQLQVVKGFRNGREVAKVTLYKRQLVERDILQGPEETLSNGILEKTILYRIGQLLKIEHRLEEIQKKKEEQLESFDE